MTHDSKEFEAAAVDLGEAEDSDDLKVSSANALILWLLMSGLGWLTVVGLFYVLS